MAQDNGRHQPLCADRREILCNIGAASAMIGLTSVLSTDVLAQSKSADLPRSMEEAGKRFRDRSLGIIELTQSYLKGVKELGPKLDAFITVTEEEALKTAAILDSELAHGKVRGPLHGMPVVYKDNIDTAGTLTTMGSAFFSTRVPQADAHVISLLKQAGVIMIGKTNMNEFAAGVAGRNKQFGDAHNPWDANRWPGGSSSGTGVAIAAGLCLGGLGTDTGISVRGPASWLGLVGVRPSYGRVSVRGVFPRAYTFDTVGSLAHTVADAAVLLQAMSAYDPEDKYAIRMPAADFAADLNTGVKGLRLGVVEDFTYRNVTPEVVNAVQASVDAFSKMGAVRR
jgi:aspartyl-tRNA(Asn)/glutamyl-tRNA(Gln) amidotransferase subunit A